LAYCGGVSLAQAAEELGDGPFGRFRHETLPETFRVLVIVSRRGRLSFWLCEEGKRGVTGRAGGTVSGRSIRALPRFRSDNDWVEVNNAEDAGRYEAAYNVKVADHHTYFVGGPSRGFAVWSHNASCDPAEVAHIQQELARNPNNLGVGVIDKRTGQVRLFTYDETDAFSRANPQLQVMAGHEAAAAMAQIPLDQARGFALGRQGSDWHVFNKSHLNSPDAQANTMSMDPQLFNEIVTALQGAGVQNPVLH
jgi:hypothetical protein